MRDPHDYTIEVCQECGAQLSRSGNGRCPIDRAHWRIGGMVVRVVARPDRQQDRHFRPGVIPAGSAATGPLPDPGGPSQSE